MRSMRQKLNLVVLATTFVALLVAGLAMAVVELRNYHRNLEHDLLSQAELIGLASATALSFNDPRAGRENLAPLKARTNIVAAAIYRVDNTQLASYLARGEALAAPNSLAPAPDASVRIEGQNLVVTRPVTDGNERLGTVYLRAHHGWLARLQQYATVLGLVMVASLALALVLSDRLVSLVMRQLLEVSNVARRITAGRDYQIRVPGRNDDEVGQVITAFNDMLDELARRAMTLEQAHAETLRLNAELEDRVRRRTSQLEEANRELETFSYSASHDLRSPLQVIGSFSTLLEKSLADKLDERQQHYVQRIQFNVRRMSELIDALLQLAHVSRTSLQRSSVDLGNVARATLEECRERDPQREVRVSVATGMKGHADLALIRQVMDNLVGNAWKFTSKTPNARIAVGWRQPTGGPHVYYVHDNGAGFDMNHAKNLFGAFQRLHTPTEFPGTGIGLATVHRIIARHEGKIWARSVPGRGTTFYFTLGTHTSDVPDSWPGR